MLPVSFVFAVHLGLCEWLMLPQSTMVTREWRLELVIRHGLFCVLCAEAAALLRSDVEAFKRKVAQSLRGTSIDGRPFPRFV